VLNYVPRYEDIWGSEGVVPRILNLRVRLGEWSASHPGRFTPELGRNPEPVWTRWRRGKTAALPEIEPCRPAGSSVTSLFCHSKVTSLCLTDYNAMKRYPLLNEALCYKDALGRGGIARCINLGTRCRWLVSFTPRPLYLVFLYFPKCSHILAQNLPNFNPTTKFHDGFSFSSFHMVSSH